eukprot:scaffold169363_cov24-Tisochrysis_lutea.AAC.1
MTCCARASTSLPSLPDSLGCMGRRGGGAVSAPSLEPYAWADAATLASTPPSRGEVHRGRGGEARNALVIGALSKLAKHGGRGAPRLVATGFGDFLLQLGASDLHPERVRREQGQGC